MQKTAYKYDEITGQTTETRASINSSTGQPNPIKSASWEPKPETPPKPGHIWGLRGNDTRDTEWIELPLCWPYDSQNRPLGQPVPSLWRDGAWIPQPRTIQGEPPDAEEGHQVLAQNGAWVQVALPVIEPQPDPFAASINALTQGTDANEVFSWMALQGLSNVAAATARNDINMNLLGLPSLWLSEGDGRLMASTGLDTAFAMLWDAVDAIPDGYQDIVAAWRAQYHLTAG